MNIKLIFIALAAAAGAPGAHAQVAPPGQQVFFGIRPSETNTPGAVVGEVVPGGTAAALGLEKDDVIIWMNGSPISSTDDMVERIRGLRIGEAVTVRVRRGDQVIERQATAQPGTPVAIPRRRIG